MAINVTQQEQNRQGALELADKMKLEARMAPEMRRFFRRLANDLEASILLTGGVQHTARYERSLEALLLTQYERTEVKFGNGLTDQLAEQEEDTVMWLVLLAIGRVLGLQSKAEVLAYIRAKTGERDAEFIDINAPKDAGNIGRTNNRHLQAAVATAGVVLTERLEREPTRAELAKESKRQFLSTSIGRSNTIAATTTQRAAEGMKDINRQVFLGYRNGMESVQLQIPQNPGNEVWVSLGDSIVRIAHILADGQLKQNGTFTVKGQLLKYPGDDSLGATLDNLINCRCSSIFTFEETGNIPDWALEPLI